MECVCVLNTRGIDVLFQPSHTSFLPCSPRPPTAAQWTLCSQAGTSASDSAPIADYFFRCRHAVVRSVATLALRLGFLKKNKSLKCLLAPSLKNGVPDTLVTVQCWLRNVRGVPGESARLELVLCLL